MDSDLVLGVAVAPTALSLVLVRGEHAEGQVLDADHIETTTPIEGARSAIMRTYSTAVKHGYRIRGIGVAQVGVDVAEVADLVGSLRQLGVRNIVEAGPANTDSPAWLAAAHALDMVRVPAESASPNGSGRHRTPTSSTSRRVALGAAATGVLAALAATVVVHATSTGAPPVAPPPTAVTAAPVASPTTSPTTTPRSVFTGSQFEKRSPTTVSVTPITAAPSQGPVAAETPATSTPPAEPETPVASEVPGPSESPVGAADPAPPPAEPPPAPPAAGSEHLPPSEDGPRPPGPA